MFRSVLEDHLKIGHNFFVRQSYPRGVEHSMVREALLITPYQTFVEASGHLEWIKDDPRRLIYRATDELHRQRLYKAALQPEGYLVFINRIESSYYSPAAPIMPQIEKYILEHTSWRPKKMSEVKVDLSVIYGEIQVELEYNDSREVVWLDVLDPQ